MTEKRREDKYFEKEKKRKKANGKKRIRNYLYHKDQKFKKPKVTYKKHRSQE